MIQTKLLGDLRDQASARESIRRLFWHNLTVQELALAAECNIDIAAKLEELLLGAKERGDPIFVCVRNGAQGKDVQILGCALITEHANSWTGTQEGYVYAFAIKEVSTSVVDVLLDAIRVFADDRSYKVLRLEVSETEHASGLVRLLESRGWTTSCLIPYKDVKTIEPFTLSDATFEVDHPSTSREPRTRIREAKSKDFPFVVGLLTEAVWMGLSGREQALFAFEQVTTNVTEEFAHALVQGACFSLVAEREDDGLCAHATAQNGLTHQILDIPEIELIDVFTVPPCQGEGVGGLLTGHMMELCASMGARLVRSTVSVEGTSKEKFEVVCANLERDGWWFNQRIMYKIVD